MTRHIRTGPLTRSKAIAFLLLTLLLGSVFLWDALLSLTPVSQEEAISAEAEFSGYSERKKRNSDGEIRLDFTDHDCLFIDSSCVDQELREQLFLLPAGTSMQLLLHPRSKDVLSLYAGETEILNFDEAQRHLINNAKGFVILGILLYCCTVYFALWLIVKSKKRR